MDIYDFEDMSKEELLDFIDKLGRVANTKCPRSNDDGFKCQHYWDELSEFHDACRERKLSVEEMNHYLEDLDDPEKCEEECRRDGRYGVGCIMEYLKWLIDSGRGIEGCEECFK